MSCIRFKLHLTISIWFKPVSLKILAYNVSNNTIFEFPVHIVVLFNLILAIWNINNVFGGFLIIRLSDLLTLSIRFKTDIGQVPNWKAIEYKMFEVLETKEQTFYGQYFVVVNQFQLLKRLTNPSMQNNILERLRNVTERMFVTNNRSQEL